MINVSEQHRGLLIDLVENKLDCMEAMDVEDRRVVKALKSCLQALAHDPGVALAAMEGPASLPAECRR